jgi:hypothetical protein
MRHIPPRYVDCDARTRVVALRHTYKDFNPSDPVPVNGATQNPQPGPAQLLLVRPPQTQRRADRGKKLPVSHGWRR